MGSVTQRPHHRVTIVDVAREAGVSKSTASRVMAGRGSASPGAHDRVTEAAARLGYQPNALAKAMVSGNSNTIGIVIPDISSPFFSAVTRGLSDAARMAGFEVIISNTDNDADIESKALELLGEKRVDGIIVAPVFQDHSVALETLRTQQFPLIYLDRRGGIEDTTPLVSLDHVAASRLATEHLIRLGHRRIAIVTEAGDHLDRLLASSAPTGRLRPSGQRLKGYLDALLTEGIEVDPELVINAGYDPDDARVQVAERLRTVSDVTAVYGTDSVLTSGAFRALRELGLRYPEDVSFLGFDDQEWSTMVQPEVTVVSQPRYRIGAVAASCLIERIRHPEAELDDVALPANLTVRQSTEAPRRF